METLAYLYHAETYEVTATKPSKKSRKKAHPTEAAKVQELSDVAYAWMP